MQPLAGTLTETLFLVLPGTDEILILDRDRSFYSHETSNSFMTDKLCRSSL